MVRRANIRERRLRSLSTPSADRALPASLTWDAKDDSLLREAVAQCGPKKWREVAAVMAAQRKTCSVEACHNRWVTLTNHGEPPEKRKWSSREDAKLVSLVEQHDFKNWALVASELPGRSAKQCRERWQNQVRPDLNQGPWTADEDAVIVAWQLKMGNKWATIASKLEGRTDNMVKNRWYSTLARSTTRTSTRRAHKEVAQAKPAGLQGHEKRTRIKSKKRRRSSSSRPMKKRKTTSRPINKNVATQAPQSPVRSPNHTVDSPDTVDGPVETPMTSSTLQSPDECDDVDEDSVKLKDVCGLADFVCDAAWCEENDRCDDWVPDNMGFHVPLDALSWVPVDHIASAADDIDEDEDEEEVEVVEDAFAPLLRLSPSDGYQCAV